MNQHDYQYGAFAEEYMNIKEAMVGNAFNSGRMALGAFKHTAQQGMKSGGGGQAWKNVKDLARESWKNDQGSKAMLAGGAMLGAGALGAGGAAYGAKKAILG